MCESLLGCCCHAFSLFWVVENGLFSADAWLAGENAVLLLGFIALIIRGLAFVECKISVPKAPKSPVFVPERHGKSAEQACLVRQKAVACRTGRRGLLAEFVFFVVDFGREEKSLHNFESERKPCFVNIFPVRDHVSRSGTVGRRLLQ